MRCWTDSLQKKEKKKRRRMKVPMFLLGREDKKDYFVLYKENIP